LIYSTMDEYLSAIRSEDYHYATHQGDFLPEIEDAGMWGDW